MSQGYKFILIIILNTCLGCSISDTEYPVPPEDALADTYISEAKPFAIGDEEYKADYGTITVQEKTKCIARS